MKRTFRFNFSIAASLLAAFAIWTIAICRIDLQAIGPRNSVVGFATINGFIHNLTGANMSLYHITDWLGLVPVAFGFGFAILGLCQWIKRKHILKVDLSILILGAFYLVVLGAYLFFEAYIINYRPVLIAGYLECSYPSSTTLLVMTVMPTAILQLRSRIHNKFLQNSVSILLAAFTVFMIAGRLVSGVHWITDIIGSALLSSGLVMLYHSFVSLK